MKCAVALTVASGLFLTACNDDPAPVQEASQASGGEVLEGTISDDMLPVESLRSEPPRAQSEDDNGADEADQEQSE